MDVCRPIRHYTLIRICDSKGRDTTDMPHPMKTGQGFPSFLDWHLIKVSPRFEPGKERRIHKWDPVKRQLVRSFHSQRVMKISPDPDLPPWLLDASFLCYKSDSIEVIPPVTLDYEDEKLYANSKRVITGEKKDVSCALSL